ncbi:MAG: hypothetical protein J6B64_00150 [Bacilli bacterium]|nr:hypothetical protein [Bacilli bacterium]MBP3635542.1 hypothetical protein [Bacilli bacterium]
MNKYQKKYYEIQNESINNLKNISKFVMKDLELITSTKFVIDKLDDINKIFYLLGTKYARYLYPILEKYNYNYHAELQYIIANLCYYPENEFDNFKSFKSLISINRIENGYQLETQFGDARVYIANRLIPDLSYYTVYGESHQCCESFMCDYKNVSASTCLIDDPFSKKHYHSLINSEDNIIDLSHNAFMHFGDYNKIFAPQILNTVSTEEIMAEAKKIYSKENLGKDKGLLLCLALEKQIK